MQASLRLFRPIIAILNTVSTFVLRLLGTKVQGHGHLHSPEEIDLLIAESRDGGLLEPEEQQRLRRALQLGLRKARDLMVPLGQLTMIAADAPWAEMVRVMVASPFSRLPVYRGTTDHIVGTVRVKDVLERFVLEGAVALDRLIRPMVPVSEDLPADRVVSVLRDKRTHQAIVVNSSGHAIGMVTIQDVLNELVGPRRTEPAART
jgi:CBS domain containing-hemolysin-like protein